LTTRIDLLVCLHVLSDLLFPRRCPVCDLPVKLTEGLICRKCCPKLHYVAEPYCMRCGKPLQLTEHDRLQPKEAAEFCYDCSYKPHVYDRGISLYRYDSIRRTIYRFKYGNRPEYAVFLGREMAQRLGKIILSWKPDALVAVPLHRTRQKKRGYNQAYLLAKELGRLLDIPVLEGWLVRVRNTKPLKMLDGRERRNNLKKAFKIVQNEVKLKTIIIIDDVYTTGSTMDEIAAVCRQNGIEKIYFAALSIGNGL